MARPEAAQVAPAAFGPSDPDKVNGFWNVSEAATYLRMSSSWVYKAARRGELPCVRFGASLRFAPGAIRAWISTRGVSM